MKKVIVLLLCAVLLAGLIFGAMQVTKKEGEVPIENAGISQNAVVKPKTLTYKGQEYPMKPHIQTVLLIGTDSVEAYEEKTDGVIPFYNRHQADFLMLLVLGLIKSDNRMLLIIRAARNRRIQSDIAAVSAHNFEQAYAVVRTHSIAQGVDCPQNGVDGRVEP